MMADTGRGWEDLELANHLFPDLTLSERLHWLRARHAQNLGMTSAFGYSGVILMYHIREVMPEIPIYFIDTRYHFPETLDFVATIRSEWGLDIRTIETTYSEQDLERMIGPQAYRSDPDICCQFRKVEPLERIIGTKLIWLNGLRRDQSTRRGGLDFFQIDSRGSAKVHPMVDWSREQCWKFIRDENLPYHPLHDANYPSVGCVHCTKPVAAGEHERAGRWVSFPDRTECGLHKFSDADE